MKRLAVVAVLTFMMSVLALAQSSGERSIQSLKPEQEIISLSRKFADEAIFIREGEALDIHDVKVRISGNTALFTSRADKRGRGASGQAYTHPHRLTVEYVKRDGGWQVVRGEWRKVTK